jgi:8-oxo-dGTP pyrophosphatase MutT (NUDIX family)
MNMLKQMTVEEKHNLKTLSFDQLWFKIWGNELISNQYRSEESVSREKFTTLHNGVFTKHEYYTLSSMIEESEQYESWTEPEWGFPKGRRKFQERDYECALREFAEETGYDTKHVRNITNIVPFEETFTGSNYKSYKHKYFLAYMDYSASIRSVQYEPTEVSQLEWKTYEQCIQSIRPYNLEKKRLLTNIHTTLQEVILYDESK